MQATNTSDINKKKSEKHVGKSEDPEQREPKGKHSAKNKVQKKETGGIQLEDNLNSRNRFGIPTPLAKKSYCEVYPKSGEAHVAILFLAPPSGLPLGTCDSIFEDR